MDKVISHFQTAQAARVCGFTIRQLDYWASTGMLVPSISQSTGPGSRKLYSFDDLVRLHFIKQLREQNWSTQKIRKAMGQLDEFMRERPNYRNFRFIHDKDTILVLCETEKKQQILLDGLNRGGQQVLWIVLEMLRAKVKQNTTQLLSLTSSDSLEIDEAI